jgi:hypothetical protein
LAGVQVSFDGLVVTRLITAVFETLLTVAVIVAL